MNYCWRISKYNPIYRDERGSYIKEEWTSISDVGKKYNGVEFKVEEYLKVENLYLNAISEFTRNLNIPFMKVLELEKRHDNLQVTRFFEYYPNKLYDLYKKVAEGDVLLLEDFLDLSKLLLREKLWCKLVYQTTMFVHFGYDYYMYIGSYEDCSQIIEPIIRAGLFVEPFQSPYEFQT